MKKRTDWFFIATIVIILILQISCNPETPAVSPPNGEAGKIPQDKPGSSSSINPIESAGIMIKNGDLNEAEKVLKQNPEQFENIYMMGIVERERGNYQEALKYFEKALKMKPDHTQALKYRSYVNYYAGNYDKAVTDFETLLKKTPEDPDIYYGLAMVYKNQGRDNEAKQLAVKGMDMELASKSKSEALKGRDSRDSSRIPFLQSITGEKEQGKIIELARMEYERDPANARAVSKFAIILYDYGRTEEAKKLIEKSFEKVPKHSLFRLHRLLGEYLNMERQYEKAYKEFETAIKLAPQGDTPAVNASISELYLLIGDVLFELKQYDKSEEVLGKAREYAEKTRQGGDIALADEKLTDYYVTMAALSMRKKDMDKADKYLKDAESIKSPDLKESNVGDVANIRAEWLMKKGRFKEAVNVLSAMAEKSTDSPDEIYIRMAAAYSGMKDKTNTVKSLKKALQVGSNKRKIATIIKTYEEFGNTINDPELQALLK